MDDQGQGLDVSILLELNAFMSEKDVMRATSLSRASIHRKRIAGDFPEPQPISDGRVGYRIRDIRDWLSDPAAWSSERNNPHI